jgi:hypothetical protein
LEGYFFPWHFAAETAPSRKLKSVTLPNMSLLLPIYLISTGQEGRCRPRKLANKNVATAGGLSWQWGNWSDAIFHKKENCSRYHQSKLCYTEGRSLTVSYKLPSSFWIAVLLSFSREPLSGIQKKENVSLTCLCLWPAHAASRGFGCFIFKVKVWM